MDEDRTSTSDREAQQVPATAQERLWLRGTDAGSRISLVAFVALLTTGVVLHLRWLLSQPTLLDAVRAASGWLRMMASGHPLAIALVFGPFVALFGLVVGLFIYFGLPNARQSVWRSLQLGALLGACLAAAWFIGTARLVGLRSIDWRFFVPIVPPALVAFQAFVTWRQRPRSVGDFRIGVSQQLRDALEASGDLRQFREVHRQLLNFFGGVAPETTRSATPPPQSVTGGMRETTTRQGSVNPASIATEFALPGLLLLLVGFGAMALAIPLPGSLHPILEGTTLRGLQWGVAGAYAYVLFTFGSRSFRNDLTVGAAIWAVITLVVGPTLAVVLAVAWHMDAGKGDTWQTPVVLFFAGLAPRRVMSIIESVALRLLKAPEEAKSNLVPLTRLSSISPELAVRLREENIEDVSGLAYADPIRLARSMPYDLRQVVNWIDQALLALALPEQYETLQARGVTGAIDLAWRWLQACTDSASDKVAIRHAAAVPESFLKLVREPDREAGPLYETARQMFYEEHVRLLWVMYNSFSTAMDQPAGSRESAGAAESVSKSDASSPSMTNVGASEPIG